MDAQKKDIEAKRISQSKYLEMADLSSGRRDRKQWESREDERDKQREESMLLKDREKEIDAIKVNIV